MATTITKVILSGSTDGRAINQSSTTVLTVHTGPSSTSIIDEIYLYADNQNTATVLVNIEFGVSSSVSLIKVNLDFESVGPQLIIPGFPLAGNASPNLISVYTTTTISMPFNIFGWVNRITQS